MSNPQTTAQIAGHPLHPMLVPFPIAFFAATLACDLAFWKTVDPMWFLATKWLLGAGLVMGALAAVAGLTDFLGDRRIRDLDIARWHFAGNLVLVLLQAFNWWRRYGADVGVVLPTGLLLSAVAVGLMLINGWLGWEMVYRRRVGIADNGP